MNLKLWDEVNESVTTIHQCALFATNGNQQSCKKATVGAQTQLAESH